LDAGEGVLDLEGCWGCAVGDDLGDRGLGENQQEGKGSKHNRERDLETASFYDFQYETEKVSLGFLD
jgi:hypothetical protein